MQTYVRLFHDSLHLNDNILIQEGKFDWADAIADNGIAYDGRYDRIFWKFFA